MDNVEDQLLNSSPLPPAQTLYYVSIHFEKNLIRTPNFYVFDNIDIAFAVADEFTMSSNFIYRRLLARKIEYVGTKILRQTLPALEIMREYDASKNQRNIEYAEDHIAESLACVLVKYSPHIRQNLYFLDSFVLENTVDKAVDYLTTIRKQLHFSTNIVHFYKPTTELSRRGFN